MPQLLTGRPMENTQHVYQLLEGATPIAKSDRALLEELTTSYPYFHGAWLLKATLACLEANKGEDVLDTLGIATVLTPDSGAVYRLLHPQPPIDLPPTTTGTGEETPIETPSTDSVPTTDAATPEIVLSDPLNETTTEELAPAEDTYEEEESSSAQDSVDLSNVLEQSLQIPITKFGSTLYTLDAPPEGLSPEDIEYVRTQLNPFYRAPFVAPKAQREAIDAFLANLDEVIANAKQNAERQEAEGAEPQNLAAQSSVMDSTLASERLADLHAQRGEIQQAISMLEILMQKYPKKSGYFAQKIAGLRNGQNPEDK